MIKFKRSSDKRQIMVISNMGRCEFLNVVVAIKLAVSLMKEKSPFVVLNKKDKIVFSSSLKLQHLAK